MRSLNVATFDIVSTSLRALGLVSALQAAGATIFLSLFGNDIENSIRAVRVLARRAAVLGILVTAVYQMAEPARMLGALSGMLDGSLHAMLLQSDVGTAHAIRVLGLLIIALALSTTNRAAHAFALMGATLVSASFAFMGHTANHDQRWMLAVLLTLHITIAAFWFGALLPLFIANKREAAREYGQVVLRFSAIATWLVPVILLAGTAMMLGLLPSFSSLQTPYGLSVLLKVALLAVLMVIASVNKWSFGPRIATGANGARYSFNRAIIAEWMLIASVLVVTAAMTSNFSPNA